MEKRKFGKTDMNVTVLGFGGAEIGFENASDSTVATLLNAALDAGLNLIDTAECYNNSEEMIGKAVSHRRKDYFLFTKCGHAAGFSEPDWNIKMLEATIDRSLKRLKTDRVDLIQLHSCSEEMLRKGDVIAVLQRAQKAGKTRYIGYSGDSKAALFAVQSGAFDSLQTSVSIADQECIELTLPLAQKAGMAVIAKRPIANAAWKDGRKPDNSYAHPYWERLQKLEYPFLKKDISASIQTALKFTLAQPGVCTAIVGTKNPQRWSANAALLNGGPLPQSEIDAIRARWKQTAKAEWVGQI